MPYMLNGDLLTVSDEPKVEGGTMFVPLRQLATALGGKADWEPSTGTVILYLNDTITTFKNGEKAVDVDGTSFELQAPVAVDNGETWVPVRFFERALGYTLVADSQNGIVDLTKTA